MVSTAGPAGAVPPALPPDLVEWWRSAPSGEAPVPMGVGVDVIEIDRVAEVAHRWGAKFLERVYTPAELAYCRGRMPELAARFAAKEAISKALGTGIRGLRWRDMEVLSDRRGKPMVALHGGARERAAAIRLRYFALSLSHARDYAVAMVVAVAVPFWSDVTGPPSAAPGVAVPIAEASRGGEA